MSGIQIMERYIIDTKKRMIELMNEHSFEVIVLNKNARVQIFLGNGKWGYATKEKSYKWSDYVEHVCKISLISNMPTEVNIK